MIGSTIGSYRITKLLGEGGMGAVYQATDNIDREVAIKVLRPQLIHDADRLGRFRSEAMALGRLHHPNITSLFHLLEQSEGIYMVMEFVEGQTLEELIYQTGALPPRLALELVTDALHGFEHAHSRGVIHRDIKASNLMVSSDGVTKIMDFGIARIKGAARLTQNDRPLGTLEYMSPEQVRGLEQDARSDIYSLGILLFELLTGRVPFLEGSDFELMRAHIEKEPPSARFLVPSLPASLDAIIARCLEKGPSERFASAIELREALEAVAAELPAAATSASLTPTSNIHPARPTNASAPSPRYATMQMEDRYATRVQGTPLPIPAPPPVAPAALSAALSSQSAPSKPVFSSRRFPVLVPLSGIVLLVVGILAIAFFRPKQQSPTSPAPRPLASRSVRAAILPTGPKGDEVIMGTQKPAPRAFPRRVRRRSRTAETFASRQFKPRRAARKVAPRRFARTMRVNAPKRPLVRSLSTSDEAAALRAIIKGN